MKCPTCGYENREDAPYCSMCQGSFMKRAEPAPWSARPSLHQILDADRHEPPVYSEREALFVTKQHAPALSSSGIAAMVNMANRLDSN